MKKTPYRLLSLVLILSALFSLCSVSATEAPVQSAAESDSPVTSAPANTYNPSESTTVLPTLVHCTAGGVINGASGEMLYALNETSTMYPAAATKLMTALIVIEAYKERMDTVISVTEAAIKNASGISVNLRVGEQLTVRQLLACMVIGSANDAALVLAHSIAGSVSAFVDQMNAKARELGMNATVYQNPTGLHHDKMVTTVGDTLLLASALYRQSEFVALSGKESFEIPETEYTRARTINNRNYLVSDKVVSDYYDPTVNGMCYGSTYEAGGVSVASSMENGILYLAVVFGGETEKIVTEAYDTTDSLGNTVHVPSTEKYVNHAFFEVKKLIDWAKASFDYFEIVSSADAVCEIPVQLGNGKSHIAVFPQDAVELYLPRSSDLTADIRTEYTLEKSVLTAPISAGETVGTLNVYYRDELMATVSLVTRSMVERSILDYYVEQIGIFLRSAQFRRWALFITIVFAGYAVCMSVWRYRARKKALLRRRREQDERRREEERRELEKWK